MGGYLMSGNIAVQNSNGQIQLITGTAKPIQSNQSIQPMFTPSKPIIQGQTGNFYSNKIRVDCTMAEESTRL